MTGTMNRPATQAEQDAILAGIARRWQAARAAGDEQAAGRDLEQINHLLDTRPPAST